jgi:hypothetical protein
VQAMTLADMIGQVDVYSAAVALGVGAGVTIIATTALARAPRKKLEMDFELARLKQSQEHAERTQANDISREKELAKIASGREIEFKRIENGMIDVQPSRSSSREG